MVSLSFTFSFEMFIRASSNTKVPRKNTMRTDVSTLEEVNRLEKRFNPKRKTLSHYS